MLEATKVTRRHRSPPSMNFEALGQSRSLFERTPVNHPYSSPCVVTSQATERCATTSPHRPVLHVDWPPGGGRNLARGCGRWPPGSVLLGSSLDSDASKSSYRLVCEISASVAACENETWTCCREGKDQPWRQIKADLRCRLPMRCS